MRQVSWSWTRAAWLAWGGLVLGITIFAYLYPWSHTVYNIYAPAAQRWWAGENIYASNHEYYRYSPLFAVVLSPLARLPDCWGGALWKALNCLCYAAGLWVWARRLLPLALSRNQLAGLFLLVLPLSVHSMYIGQANLLMLGALLLGMAAVADQHWNRAAGWLAVATLIKGYPLALALMLAGLFPRRFALRFLAALAIGLLLPFAAHWPSVVAGQYVHWLDHLRDSTAIMRERLRSLDYLFQVSGRPLPPAVFAGLGLLAGAVVFGLSWLSMRRQADPREGLTRVWLLFSAWVVLFGPATESCTYVVAAPALAWCVVDVYRRPAWPLTRLLLIASQLLMGPLVTDLFGPAVRNFANEHGSQPIGALLFLTYLLSQTGRRCQPDRATQTPRLEASLPAAA